MKYFSEDRFGPRDGGKDSLAPWKSKPVPGVRSPARGSGSIATPRPPSTLLELEGTHVPAPSRAGCTQVLTSQKVEQHLWWQEEGQAGSAGSQPPHEVGLLRVPWHRALGQLGLLHLFITPEVTVAPPEQLSPRAARLGSARRPGTSTPCCWEQGASQYSHSRCLGDPDA